MKSIGRLLMLGGATLFFMALVLGEARAVMLGANPCALSAFLWGLVFASAATEERWLE